MSDPHKFIQTAALVNLYDAIVGPNSPGEELLVHAMDCVECDHRIDEASTNAYNRLSDSEKIELEVSARWTMHRAKQILGKT